MPTIRREPKSEALEPVHEDGARLADALGELIRVVQFRDRDRACCHGLSVTQCYALKVLADHGPSTVNEVAAELYLDKSTASRVLQGLAEAGLTRRSRDPGDRRRVVVSATEAGQRLHDRIHDDLAREYGRIIEDFDPAFRPSLLKLMDRLARSFAARVEASSGTCCVLPSHTTPTSSGR